MWGLRRAVEEMLPRRSTAALHSAALADLQTNTKIAAIKDLIHGALASAVTQASSTTDQASSVDGRTTPPSRRSQGITNWIPRLGLIEILRAIHEYYHEAKRAMLYREEYNTRMAALLLQSGDPDESERFLRMAAAFGRDADAIELNCGLLLLLIENVKNTSSANDETIDLLTEQAAATCADVLLRGSRPILAFLDALGAEAEAHSGNVPWTCEMIETIQTLEMIETIKTLNRDQLSEYRNARNRETRRFYAGRTSSSTLATPAETAAPAPRPWAAGSAPTTPIVLSPQEEQFTASDTELEDSDEDIHGCWIGGRWIVWSRLPPEQRRAHGDALD